MKQSKVTSLRRAISLACAVVLFTGGCALLFWEFSGQGRVFGRIVIIPFFMMAVGAVWFFSDLPQNSRFVKWIMTGSVRPLDDGES